MERIVYVKLLRGGYRAELGRFSECGATKKAALDALLAAIAAIPSNVEPEMRKDSRGATWLLWHEGRCWSYKTASGSWVIVDGDKTRARDLMLQHMAHYYD